MDNQIWKTICKCVSDHGLRCRVLLLDGCLTDWSPWLTLPSPSYAEIKSYGPFRLLDVVYVEIESIESRHVGNRVPPKLIDHSEEVRQELDRLDLAFEQTQSTFRVQVAK